MAEITINVPDGLDEQQTAELAERLTQIAAQAAAANGSAATMPLNELAGFLKGDQPAETRAAERAAVERHIVERHTRGDG